MGGHESEKDQERKGNPITRRGESRHGPESFPMGITESTKQNLYCSRLAFLRKKREAGGSGAREFVGIDAIVEFPVDGF